MKHHLYNNINTKIIVVYYFDDQVCEYSTCSHTIYRVAVDILYDMEIKIAEDYPKNGAQMETKKDKYRNDTIVLL